MTDNVSLISGVASRYATALLDLSEEQGSVAEVEKALAGFEKLLQDSDDLRRLVHSPVFSADDPLTCVARGGGRALELMDENTGDFFATN